MDSGDIPALNDHDTNATAVKETPFYITAKGVLDKARRVLKHGDTFAVFNSFGDIGTIATGEDGVFHRDTRHLSRLEFRLNGLQPLLLGSNIRDDNSVLTVDLTNPDIFFDKKLVLPKDAIHINRSIFFGMARHINASARGISVSRPSILRCRYPLQATF